MDAPAAGFYHDDHQQASSTSTTATTTSTGGNNYPSKEDIKKRLTLDLNGPSAQRPGCLKKPRFDVLLSSPDLNMLKLPSPELEKLIMQQNGLLSATPTPSQFLYPNPRTVTHEQEIYARGFDDALAELHQNETAQQQQQQQQQPTCSSASNSSGNNNSGGGSTSSSGGGLVSAVEYCQPTYSSHSQAANYAAGNQSLQVTMRKGIVLLIVGGFTAECRHLAMGGASSSGCATNSNRLTEIYFLKCQLNHVDYCIWIFLNCDC